MRAPLPGSCARHHLPLHHTQSGEVTKSVIRITAKPEQRVPGPPRPPTTALSHTETDDVEVEGIDTEDELLVIRAPAHALLAACPGCGVFSAGSRPLCPASGDSPVGGRPVVIALQARRWGSCRPGRCPAGGEPDGAGEPVDTAAAGPRAASPGASSHASVLGVDEFALRKGHIYGTIPMDIEPRRSVDLLPGRSVPTAAQWLAHRPGVEVICRDRSTACAEAGGLGRRTPTSPSPDASEVVPSSAAWPRRTGRLARRIREQHAAVHRLPAQGMGLRRIARNCLPSLAPQRPASAFRRPGPLTATRWDPRVGEAIASPRRIEPDRAGSRRTQQDRTGWRCPFLRQNRR